MNVYTFKMPGPFHPGQRTFQLSIRPRIVRDFFRPCRHTSHFRLGPPVVCIRALCRDAKAAAKVAERITFQLNAGTYNGPKQINMRGVPR